LLFGNKDKCVGACRATDPPSPRNFQKHVWSLGTTRSCNHFDPQKIILTAKIILTPRKCQLVAALNAYNSTVSGFFCNKKSFSIWTGKMWSNVVLATAREPNVFMSMCHYFNEM